jgi:hypothetical protein
LLLQVSKNSTFCLYSSIFVASVDPSLIYSKYKLPKRFELIARATISRKQNDQQTITFGPVFE